MSEEKKVTKKRMRVSPDGVHLKELVWERVVMRGGQPIREVWLFRGQDFPCGLCKQTDTIVFISLPTGVYKSCENCGLTHGIEPIDSSGNYLAVKLKEEPITIEKAFQICAKHKHTPPAGLPLRKPVIKEKTEEVEVED